MEYHISEEIMANLKDKVNDLFMYCEKYGIPAFATFVVGNNKKGSEYLSTDKEYFGKIISPGSCNISLKDDKIKEHLKLCVPGYSVVHKKNNNTINGDELNNLFANLGEIPVYDDTGYDWSEIENGQKE